MAPSLFSLATVAFLNGANDISRSIAVLVGAGIRDYKKACQIGTIGTMLGSILSLWLANRMVETFTKSWTAQPLQSSPFLILGVSFTITLWLTVMTCFGLPTSTTHAIVGAIIGLGLVTQGWEQVLWDKVATKIFLPLLLSPSLAFSFSWLLYRTLVFLDKVNPCLCVGEISPQLNPDAQGEVIAIVPARNLSLVFSSAQSCRQFLRHQVGITADHLHLLSAMLIAVARALNDTPKIVALGLLAQSSISQPLFFVVVTLAMGAGSFIGGWRVTQTLANRITTLDNRTGLSANLTTALLVAGCANLGLPVSTTHVAGGSILGAGIVKGSKSVYWDVVRNIALAWLVTLPMCALSSAALSFVLIRL
ncbi:inorganic phosphate transporter, PiT family [Candidatus Fervidibacteria bacterium JGI MDM2 JNZ-1-D12]